MPTSLALNYGVFVYDSLINGDQLGKSSTLYPGIIDAPTTYVLLGLAEGQTVPLQIRAWPAQFGADWRAARGTAAWYAETDVREVTLGPAMGPGTVIWQGRSGTSPNRFHPLSIVFIPEPQAVGLLALGGLLLGFSRWRSSLRK